MGKSITKVKLPVKDEIHSYIVAGDWHSHHLDRPSLDILLKFAKRIPRNQRRLIINGDFIDAEHLMKKSEHIKRAKKSSHYIEDVIIPLCEEEYEWGNNILDECQKVFDYVYFNAGNHDWRVDWFKDAIAPHAYKHNFNLQSALYLKERGIPYVGYNDWLDIGKISVTHGMFHNVTCHKKHYEACGRSVVFSHVHKDEHKSFLFRGHTKQAWSLPAMCKLNPEYIKNTDNNWTNGFGTINVKSNGNFNVHIHTIWDNELVCPDGKLITA